MTMHGGHLQAFEAELDPGYGVHDDLFPSFLRPEWRSGVDHRRSTIEDRRSTIEDRIFHNPLSSVFWPTSFKVRARWPCGSWEGAVRVRQPGASSCSERGPGA